MKTCVALLLACAALAASPSLSPAKDPPAAAEPDEEKVEFDAAKLIALAKESERIRVCYGIDSEAEGIGDYMAACLMVRDELKALRPILAREIKPEDAPKFKKLAQLVAREIDLRWKHLYEPSWWAMANNGLIEKAEAKAAIEGRKEPKFRYLKNGDR